MPGHYKVGVYYDTSEVVGTANASQMFWGRYGGYLLMDQMVWRFGSGADRGLILVLDGTISDIRTAQIPYWLLAAAVVQGPLPSRPNDFLGLGFIRAWVNGRAIDTRQAMLAASGRANPMLELGENVVELSYGFQATPWLLLHPNVQYISNPGAFSFKHIPNAWAFGLATKITF